MASNLASQLFRKWCEAAAQWRLLRSDPAEAKCRAARAAYYAALAQLDHPPAPAMREEAHA